MSEWIGAALFTISFLVLVGRFRLLEKSRDVIAIAHRCVEVVRSSQSEKTKESLLQKNSKQLFGLFLILAFGGVGAVLLPTGLLWLGEQLGLVALSSVFNTLLSPAFLFISILLAAIAFLTKLNRAVDTKPRQTSGQVQASDFSQLERTLYRLAFKTDTAQVALADIEDLTFSKQLSPYRTNRPVFIAALPRAGTTLLLECFASMPEFASHCYRDLPFVLIPCFWNHFSRPFQQTIESQERAHGDGMQITPDSPEALEEVVWKSFWRRHYQKDRIVPWQNENDREFETFFQSHMRKIIMLRREQGKPSGRYVSKNNLNIARMRMLNQLFPDSTIIIPFRHPLYHSASLLEQHRNFLSIHKEDSFAAEYMGAIGHYDFGQNLRPIDFDGWLDKRESRNANSLAFWMEYWVASYKHLLAGNTVLNFLDYDALCKSPEQGFKSLAEVVNTRNPDALISSAARIRRPRLKEIDKGALSPSLVREASLIRDRLKEVSLN